MSQPSFNPSPKLVALVEAMKQHTRQQEALLKPTQSYRPATQPPQIKLRQIASGFSPWVAQSSRNAYQQVLFQVDVSEHLAVPQAFALPIQTILTHLLQNALSHGIEPSRERVKLGKKPLSLLHLTMETDEDELIITLCDDGRGLPELFYPTPVPSQPTYRESFSSRAGDTSIFAVPSGGTGLGVGLHIVKSLAQKLSGDVRFRSLPQLGTTVIVSLPLSSAICR